MTRRPCPACHVGTLNVVQPLRTPSPARCDTCRTCFHPADCGIDPDDCICGLTRPVVEQTRCSYCWPERINDVCFCHDPADSEWDEDCWHCDGSGRCPATAAKDAA